MAIQFSWHGLANFTIKGDKAIVVTDPFTKDYGLKVPRLGADIVTISHDHKDHNNADAVKGTEASETPFVITQPGEYELKDTFIYGVPSWHDESQGSERGTNIIYRFEMEGMSIVHLGDLGHALENGQLEKLEGTDILLIPVGGTFSLDAKQAGKVISQLEPRIVIPMHYNISGLKLSKKIAGVEEFNKEIGISPAETVNKFKIAKKDLPSEDMQVVIMTP